MTLLSAINEVCDIVALDRFDSIYGSNDPNAQTMVALAQESGEEISRRGDWRRLLKQQVAIISPMTLPADYQRLPVGSDQDKAQIEWEYATTFNRLHPLIGTVGTALGLSDTQIDALWVAAAAL